MWMGATSRVNYWRKNGPLLLSGSHDGDFLLLNGSDQTKATGITKRCCFGSEVLCRSVFCHCSCWIPLCSFVLTQWLPVAHLRFVSYCWWLMEREFRFYFIPHFAGRCLNQKELKYSFKNQKIVGRVLSYQHQNKKCV